MVRKKIIQIVFSVILCGSLVFLTACQSKENQRKSKIDQETTRVAKEIDKKLKVKGYTSDNISEALMDIYYPQNLFPRVYSGNSYSDYESFRGVSKNDESKEFCLRISENEVDIQKKCTEVSEVVILGNKKSPKEYPRLTLSILDFSSYQNYNECKKLKTPIFQDKKYGYLETNNKSRFVMAVENSGHIKVQTKTDTEPQKIENLIPETAEADRYEFMYTVFTKLNIPEN